jgi:hypothetical protein
MTFIWHHFERKFNWSRPKNEAKRKACGLENLNVSQSLRLFLSLFLMVFNYFSFLKKFRLHNKKTFVD